MFPGHLSSHRRSYPADVTTSWRHNHMTAPVTYHSLVRYLAVTAAPATWCSDERSLREVRVGTPYVRLNSLLVEKESHVWPALSATHWTSANHHHLNTGLWRACSANETRIKSWKDVLLSYAVTTGPWCTCNTALDLQLNVLYNMSSVLKQTSYVHVPVCSIVGYTSVIEW